MVLAWIAATFVAGAAAGALFGWDAWPAALAVACAALAIAIWRRSRAALVYAAVLPLVFAGGLARFEQSSPHTLPADAIAHHNDGVSMRFRGVVRDDPTLRDESQRFAVSVRQVQRAGEWVDASGGVLVVTRLLPRYRAGDVIEIEGALETPPDLDGFNYADYLARRGIRSTVAFPRLRVVGYERPGPYRVAVLEVRRKLSRALDLALPEPHSSLAQGVLLGQRSALPPALLDDLNDTNTSHMVVVSGQNVVIVAAFAMLFLTFWLGRRPALWISIAAVLAYAAVVGFDPPVARATIMGILYIIARTQGRVTNATTSVLAAAAIMVAHDPQILRDVSFQLSFSATVGLIYVARPVSTAILSALAWALRRDGFPRWFATLAVEPLGMTTAAIVATAPLIALHFGRFSMVAVPANMLIVPAFPLILLATFVAALGGLLPEYRLVFAAPAYYLLEYWIIVARTLASLPGAVVATPRFGLAGAVVAYAVVGVLVGAVLRFLRRVASEARLEYQPLDLRRVLRPAMVAVPAAVFAVTAGFVFWPQAPPRLHVTVLDVGQGDAILVRSPGGQDILIDGGPGGAVLRGLGDALPWHDRSIDLVVLTHADADHLWGLLDVLDRYDVKRVVAGGGPGAGPAFDLWLRALDEERAAVEDAVAGVVYDLGDGVLLEVVGPPPSMLDAPSANDRGAVLRLAWGDVSFLFAADIERPAEAALVASGADISATVLKVPHHGSATSSTGVFLDAVRPQVAVVSAGRDNRFGHPRPEVVERISRYADLYVTAESGAVRFTTDGQRLWIETER